MEAIGKYILDFVIAVALALIIKCGVPYIKSRITAEKLNFIKTWVESLVAAAEQTIKGSKMGPTKKAWVISMLEKLGIVVDDTVDALIESAVLALNSTVNIITDAIIEGAELATDGAVTEEKINTVAENITGAGLE